MEQYGELAFRGLAYIPLRWVVHRVECLELEFTFAVRGRNMESEFPSEPLGPGDLSDTSMPMPLTVESHLATLPGVENESVVSSMVFCGV